MQRRNQQRRGFLTSAASEKKDLRRMADQARPENLDTKQVYNDEANAFDDHPGQGSLSEVDTAAPDTGNEAGCSPPAEHSEL